MHRFVVPVLLAASIGCTREPTPISLTGDQLMVHSIVLAGSDTVHVHVSRSLADPIRDPSLPAGFLFSRPVSGADVRMIQGQSSVTLHEAPAGFSPCAIVTAPPGGTPQAEPGCYAAHLPGGIRPGDVLRLEVRLGAAGVAEGNASIPQVPEFVGMASPSRQTLSFGSSGGGAVVQIPVRYQLPPQATGIRAGLQLDEVFRGGRRVPEALCSSFSSDPFIRRSARTDSTRIQLYGVYCHRDAGGGRFDEFLPDSVLGRIVLTGFDSTYVRYAEAAQQQSAEATRLRAGVTGALGVFAGASTATHPLVLIQATGGTR